MLDWEERIQGLIEDIINKTAQHGGGYFYGLGMFDYTWARFVL